jgi:citrate lyase beta subunit
VIIDLGDAVASEQKEKARANTRELLARGGQAVVRINGRQTTWFDDDLAALVSSGATALVEPKVEASAEVAGLADLSLPLISLSQTPRGVLLVRESHSALLHNCKAVDPPSAGGRWSARSFGPSAAEIQWARSVLVAEASGMSAHEG